jgi:hypothetical protein
MLPGPRIFCLSSICLLAGICLSQSRPAVPVRIPLPPTSQPSEAAPGIEDPTVYEILERVATLPPAGETQGIPYDRKVLLEQPEAFVGILITVQAKYVEVEQVRLKSAPESTPGLAWSTLVIDSNRDPIQVLSLGPRPQLTRLARIRCIGYFCKVRLDQAAAPDRKTGKVATVQVPVLAGWILPDDAPPVKPALPAAPWQIFGAAVAAALLLFFFMRLFVRRRIDWRTRVAQRRHRTRDWTDRTDGL